MDDIEILAISAIQHYAYCPRQFALIHIEQVWEENRFTAEGQLLHQRVDGGEPEQRGSICYERSVMLTNHRLGLVGKMDLLEIDSSVTPAILRPVEYKRGKSKTQNWDRLQLCAQAMCLEEMRNVQVDEGAIWYWETRHRETMTFSASLREETERSIHGARSLLLKGATPPPTQEKRRCKGCSLIDHCQPDRFRHDQSSRYIQEIFRE